MATEPQPSCVPHAPTTVVTPRTNHGKAKKNGGLEPNEQSQGLCAASGCATCVCCLLSVVRTNRLLFFPRIHKSCLIARGSQRRLSYVTYGILACDQAAGFSGSSADPEVLQTVIWGSISTKLNSLRVSADSGTLTSGAIDPKIHDVTPTLIFWRYCRRYDKTRYSWLKFSTWEQAEFRL